MTVQQLVEQWKEWKTADLPQYLQQELASIEVDQKALEDRFIRDFFKVIVTLKIKSRLSARLLIFGRNIKICSMKNMTTSLRRIK